MMPRKRLTQIFPFLLPIRKWQRKVCFYIRMRLDGNKYARVKGDPLAHVVCQARQAMINEHTGFEVRYQRNKAHNLRVAARPIDGIRIRPGEVFSFWQLVRAADRKRPYRPALTLVDDKLVTVYGGGLCQLSNLLFWCFLHSPLTVLERHPHSNESFPWIPGEIPEGTDAAVSEGWLDLKVHNQTNDTYQVCVGFSEQDICIQLRCTAKAAIEYMVHSENLEYLQCGDALYRQNDIYRKKVDAQTGAVLCDERLYRNRCRLNYPVYGIQVQNG